MFNPKHPEDPGFRFPFQIVFLKFNGLWPSSPRAEQDVSARGKLEHLKRLLYSFLGWFAIIDVAAIMYWEFRFVINVFPNLRLITETLAANCMGMLVVPRMFHLKLSERKFYNMIKIFMKEIWIPKGSHARIERECEESLRPYRMMAFLLFGVGCMYCLVPIIQTAQLGWESQDKPMPYPMYFEFDVQQREIYIFIYLVSSYGGVVVLSVLIAEDSLLGLFLTYTCGQYQILHERIDNIKKTATKIAGTENGPNNTEILLKEYIKELNSIAFKQNRLMKFVEQLEETMSLIILVNFSFSTAILVLIGFQLSTGTGMLLTDYIKFCIYIMSILSQLILLCWNGDRLMQISAQTAHHLYACKWEEHFADDGHELLSAAKEFRRHLQIMIMCSQRPLKVTAGKFAPVSLPTFSRVLSSSVSYFTLLQSVYKRQS